MTTICYTYTILMKLTGYITSIKIRTYIEFGADILRNSKNGPIVSMTVIRYFGPMVFIPTYNQQAASGVI